jgi:peptidoglycan/LPS O-acetylase OafA/YrhL
MKRIDNLTGLRAFAAVWVVLHHLQTATAHFRPLGPIVGNGYLGVDVFFVLSGFVLSLVYAPALKSFSAAWYKKFLVRRFAKIYPMHIITFLIVVGLVLVANHVHYHFAHVVGNNWWSALCNILLLQAFGLTRTASWNTFSWSVSAEWFAYTMLFPPMILSLRRWTPAAVAALVVMLWAGFLLLCRYVLHSDPILTTRGVLRIIPEFAGGYLLYRVIERGPRLGNLPFAAGAALLVIIAFWPVQLFFLSLPAILLVIAGSYRGGRWVDAICGNRLAILVGEASYSIYIMHFIGLVALNLILHRLQPHFMLQSVVVEAISCAALCTLGVLTYLYLEEPLRLRVIKSLSAPPASVAEQVVAFPSPSAEAQITPTAI